jgi:hypothetical protein
VNVTAGRLDDQVEIVEAVIAERIHQLLCRPLGHRDVGTVRGGVASPEHVDDGFALPGFREPASHLDDLRNLLRH